MFESDDFDFDQDFLKDVDEKATQFYSQTDNTEEESRESQVKRRKVEICNDSIFSMDSDENWKTETLVKPQEMSRKNMILEIFNKNSTQKVPSNFDKACKKTVSTSHLNPNNNKNQVSRKDLILGILKKADVKEKVIQNDQCTSFGAKNLENTEYNVSLKDNKNINNPKMLDSRLNLSSNSKRQNLIDVLKLSVKNNKTEKSKSNWSPMKIPQAHHSKKTALVRRFPGPAGLLSDTMDTTIAPILELNNLEETEKDNQINSTKSHPYDYCSQDTENLFTEGAWQLMLDDLPKNFLKGYEIATANPIARENYCKNNMKIQFMAGVLEHIDHSHENPVIILKDITGTIRGIVHRDISLKYANLFKQNVVLLLHDVGLIRPTKSLNKYYILISPSNLLGIYANQDEIMRAPDMETIIQDSLNGKTEAKKDRIRKPWKGPMEKNEINNIQDPKKSLNSNTASNAIFEECDLMNLEFADDFSFNEITDTKQNQSNERLNNLREPPTSETAPTDQLLEKKNNEKNHLDESTKKNSKSIVDEWQTRGEKTDMKSNEKNAEVSRKSSMRNRLLQFRSKDVLTPPESANTVSSESEILTVSIGAVEESDDRNLSHSESYSFRSMLSNTKNDSDDEILSQLDVDAIFSNYTKNN